MERKKLGWLMATTISTFILLTIVQCIVKPPLLLGERIIANGGWAQVTIATLLSGWLFIKMYPRQQRALWRQRIWILFSVVFFGQLLLGISVDSFFLMSGKLHFPIPGLIPAGAVYRPEFSFMPILFLITVVLSGGAWCSQLCYFGALDSFMAGQNQKQRKIINQTIRQRLRWSILALFIIVAIALRFFNVSSIHTTAIAATAGIIGLLIILVFSRKKGRMVHCSCYCPAGTLVSYLKFLSPWRFRINNKCTQCQACSRTCRYGALQKEDIRQGRPAINCTACGDCLSACRHNALEYRFAGCSPDFSEHLWICVNVVLFTCFLMIARI